MFSGYIVVLYSSEEAQGKKYPENTDLMTWNQGKYLSNFTFNLNFYIETGIVGGNNHFVLDK